MGYIATIVSKVKKVPRDPKHRTKKAEVLGMWKATSHRTLLSETQSPLLRPSHRPWQLGRLFLWSGCAGAAFWTYWFIQLGNSVQPGDFAPLAIYSALTVAGFAFLRDA